MSVDILNLLHSDDHQTDAASNAPIATPVSASTPMEKAPDVLWYFTENEDSEAQGPMSRAELQILIAAVQVCDVVFACVSRLLLNTVRVFSFLTVVRCFGVWWRCCAWFSSSMAYSAAVQSAGTQTYPSGCL
jgi:hypothetical protein